MNQEQRNLAYKLTGVEFLRGDKVRKVKGYHYPGVVVAAFPNLSGDHRYVVECTAPDCAGMLHIFNGEQLELVKETT